MINLDGMTDDEKMAALESIHQSIADSKEVQKQKITSNVEMIVKALKKIESDIKQRYDQTGALIESIKNGADGRDGIDGKNGKDGRNGKDGPAGPRGFDGAPGRDGANGQDGISVVDAQVHFDGGLTFTLSNGQIINAGEIVNPDTAENIKVITNGGGTSQTVLDTLASLQAQISAIVSGLSYKGTWNASTNTPTLTSSVGTAGFYYIVSVAGSTNLNGITDWQVGDWAVFSGSVWQKLDQTNLVTSVAGRTGAVTLSTGDISGLGTIATQASSNVTITGGSITGITDLAIADGGTGQSTAAAAITALTGTQTSGYYLRSNGTNASLSAIQAADVPTLNQNTTGSAASLSATNPVSRGGTNLTTLTNKGVLYASSTSQVATGTALQFDGTNFGMDATPSSWGSTYRAIEIGAQTALSYESNGSIKSTSLATNSYNATNTGARPYYKENGLATQYQQNVGEHAWYTAPTGIAGSSTTITTGKIYTNLTAGNQADFGAVNGLVGTIWTATSSGTLTSGTVVQNIDFVESMRIDAYGYVKIGSLIASKAVFTDSSKNLVSTGTVGIDQGGTGATTAANARTNLGATTVGSNVFTLTNPSAITFPRFNADNTVSALDAATFRTAIGAGTSSSSGTVTSVAITVPSILSVSGSPITSSGTFAISLSGTALPVGNGGTGQTTSIAALNALLPTQTGNANKYLQTDGTNASWDAVSLSTSDISGTLGTTNGGTGLTSFTANGVVYASSSSALATGSALTFDGTSFFGGTNIYASGRFYAQRSSSSLNLPIAGYTDGSAGTVLSGTKGDIVAFGNAGGDGVIFANANTEQMRLTSTGLGIGTSSPTEKLTVNGNIKLGTSGTVWTYGPATTGRSFFANSDGTAYVGVYGSSYGGSSNAILSFVTGTSNTMTMDSSGNLGLGVTPPNWSSGGQISLGNNKTIVASGEYTNLGTNWYYSGGYNKIVNGYATNYYQALGAHIWQTAGTGSVPFSFTSAMTLDASGNLLVGTTSTGLGKLNVNGTISTANDSGGTFALAYNAHVDSRSWRMAHDVIAYGDFAIQQSTTQTGATFASKLLIDSSGNLRIGTTAALFAANERVSINGATGEIGQTIYANGTSSIGLLLYNSVATGATSGKHISFTNSSGTEVGSVTSNGTATLFNTTSDQRLKENIVDAPEFGSVIDSIKVRSYEWKADGSHQRAGFIAQELVTVAPEAVYQPLDTDEMMAVDYSKLVPMLVKEIQSLRKRLADAGI